MSDNLTDNARTIVERRYLKKDETGKAVETVEGMFNRVATHVAAAFTEKGTSEHDELSRKYYEMMSSLKFLPNTPTFTGAGTSLGQLAACFVLPIDDDIGKDSTSGIFETLSKAARIQQSGGGVGFSFSRLRPRGDRVAKSSGIASGPISFMRVYATALSSIRPVAADEDTPMKIYDVCDSCVGAAPIDFSKALGPVEAIRVYNSAFAEIAQGGTRRGASMGCLAVTHPDILEFIRCKSKDETSLTGFNLSVAITDDFMRAVIADGCVTLKNPRNNETWPYTDPATGITRDYIAANVIFDQIVRCGHANGEPGVLFLDRLNATNPLPHLYNIETTNPCGISPLLASNLLF
jgi:ribonucleoside-diphosphate reductase alpha chain